MDKSNGSHSTHLLVSGSAILDVFSRPEKQRGGFRAFSLRRILMGTYDVSSPAVVSTVKSSWSAFVSTELERDKQLVWAVFQEGHIFRILSIVIYLRTD